MAPDTPPAQPAPPDPLARLWEIMDYAETLPRRNRDGSLASPPPPEEVAS